MKLRAVHLLTDPQSERERRSVADISGLQQYGIEYLAFINPIWVGEVPAPRVAADRPFTLTNLHYGCWKAHHDAILDHFIDDLDGLLVFECDALFSESTAQFYNRIIQAYEACVRHSLVTFTFGHKHNGRLTQLEPNIATTTQWISTHAYLIPRNGRRVFFEMLSQPWDAYDYCTTVYLYDRGHQRIGIFMDRPVTVQADGQTLIYNARNTTENYFRNLRY